MSSEEHELELPGAVLDATRLLRSRTTGQYWSPEGWRPTMEGAAKFSDEIDAARACVIHDLHQVDLVLRSAAGTEISSAPLR